ncbi:MAG: stringent starvation protein B, partial [Gammaproteobacteria bacterium]|nr:stringent starvation protein B [Gammaproteobacteria bacterium]
MTTRNPYLLRAIYDWILDNQLTPHLLVDTEEPDVEVPVDYIEDGQIVLNIHPRAVNALHMGNEFVEFSARFNG